VGLTVTDDIVTRLRKRHGTEGWVDDPNVEADAANEIERLRIHNAYLLAVNQQMNEDLTDLSNR